MKKTTTTSMEFNPSKPISLSFAGCGFLGLYHVGVAACMREYAPINSTTKFLGASAGSLAAMALVCDMPLSDSTSEILHVAMKARARALGPFHPSFDVNRIIYESLMRTLPDDAHIKANGRLYISVTRMSDGKNVIINKFKSKEELIKAVQCSCFIPLWSGLVPPKFNGIAYIDGGASDNLPILDENTITVSPFSGECDICPQDDTYNLFQFSLANTSISFSPANLYRISRILFPAHPEILSKMCQQGFDDALKFLQRNNKISCTRCLAIHFTLEKEEKEDNNYLTNNGKLSQKSHHQHAHTMENCRECEYRRQIAVLDSLPEGVVLAIQEACDQVNKGLINWIFRHRPMKLLAILTIPYLLPIDVTIVLFCKIYEKLPDIQQGLKDSFMRLVSFLQSLLVKIESKRYFYSAKFSCQLAVKEIDYTLSDDNLTRMRKHSSQSHLRPSFLMNTSEPNIKYVEKDFETQKKLFRKTSYAGREFNKAGQNNGQRPTYRRKSMIEIGGSSPGSLPPERVISQLNFDFKLDVKNSKSKSQLNDDDALDFSKTPTNIDNKVLDIDINEIDQNNAIEIANKALGWEKEFLEKCHDRLSDNENGNFDKMFEITKKSDAVMAYYYTDENNKVKFTEMFTIKDEDMNKIEKNDDQSVQMDHEQSTTIAYEKDNGDGLVESNRSPALSKSLPETPKKKQRKLSSISMVD